MPHDGCKASEDNRECGKAGSYPEGQFRSRPRDCMRRACPKRHWDTGKAGPRSDPRARRPTLQNVQPPSGVTEKEIKMTKTFAIARANTEILSIAAAALIGLSLIFVAGMSHSATAHDLTHDSRHAIGFPCH